MSIASMRAWSGAEWIEAGAMGRAWQDIAARRRSKESGGV